MFYTDHTIAYYESKKHMNVYYVITIFIECLCFKQ